MQLLVPELKDPNVDDAFAVPFLGRDTRMPGEVRGTRGARGAAAKDAEAEVSHQQSMGGY